MMGVLNALAAVNPDEEYRKTTGALINSVTAGLRNKVFKAAGQDLINLMESTPPDKDITALDVMKIAQKWKLSEESMQKLMQQVKDSGALEVSQMQRRAARQQLQDQDAVRRAEPAIKRAMTQPSMESAMNQLNSLYPGKPGDEDYLPLSGILEPMKTMSEIQKNLGAGTGGDLSYHVEKRAIDEKHAQDYRIFTNKQGEVVSEQPIGTPYPNSAGVADIRVQAFSSVPTSVPGIGYNRAKKYWFKTDDAGNEIKVSSGQVMDAMLKYKEDIPTNDLKVMQQSVPSVKQLIRQVRGDMEAISGNLGPGPGRWRNFWSGKVGAKDPTFRKLYTDIGLLETRLMRMHVGARGGVEILKHFKEMIDAGKDSPENMLSALDSMDSYADHVAMPLKDQKADFGIGESKGNDPLGIRGGL